MPKLNFGEQMPNQGGTQYLRVKAKGEQVKFRIAQPPVYTGKHFAPITSSDGRPSWDVTVCPRIENGDECDLCIEFFKIKAQAKKVKDTDEKEFKKLENDARKYQVATQFYFPVLNRDTEEFAILQTTFGVRNKIDEYHNTGADVMEKDFILRNTGSASPRDLYSLTIVDSADTTELTDKEITEYAKAVEFDMSSIGEPTASEE